MAKQSAKAATTAPKVVEDPELAKTGREAVNIPGISSVETVGEKTENEQAREDAFFRDGYVLGI